MIQARQTDEKLVTILRKLFGSGWGMFGRLQVADESGKKKLENKKTCRRYRDIGKCRKSVQYHLHLEWAQQICCSALSLQPSPYNLTILDVFNEF